MDLSNPSLLSSLRRNRAGSYLVILQIAITLAVMCNAASIVTRAVARIDRPPGFNTRDTFMLIVAGTSKRLNIMAAATTDLAYLRALPGVVAATVTNGRPMTNDGTFTALRRTASATASVDVKASELPVDQQGLRALGLHLVAGRNFRADEIIPYSPNNPSRHAAQIIVTRALAQALFPRGEAVGHTVYAGREVPLTIVGVSSDFMGPQFGQPAYNVVLMPEFPGKYGFYDLLVRTRPGLRDAIFRAVKRHIAAAHTRAIVAFAQTLSAARRHFNANSRNIALILCAVTVLMLAVCCLGLFGVTAFNVSTRTKQIGVRRAIGARRRDIVRQFVGESALILGIGIVLGSILTLALGHWLSTHYGEPRPGLPALLGGIATLWVVGQLAAWQPARRAARVPPSVATRTV